MKNHHPDSAKDFTDNRKALSGQLRELMLDCFPSLRSTTTRSQAFRRPPSRLVTQLTGSEAGAGDEAAPESSSSEQRTPSQQCGRCNTNDHLAHQQKAHSSR